ncbi:hypothetical protein ACWGHD_00380 [Streptomyces xanthophaeus]
MPVDGPQCTDRPVGGSTEVAGRPDHPREPPAPSHTAGPALRAGAAEVIELAAPLA